MNRIRLLLQGLTTSVIPLCMCLTMMSAPLSAGIMITNGGFESGLTGWTVENQLGGEGRFFLQSGTASPVIGDSVPAPPEGFSAAMTDAEGPGSHVLYQDFVVPTTPLGEQQLAFRLFVGNRGIDFFTPGSAGLDFSTVINQQARVDIMRDGADVFSTSPTDVLQSIYQTQPGDPLVSGYLTIISDVTAALAGNQGNTLRLRFAEVDNLAPLQMGVDNVRFQSVPEPSSLAFLGLGAMAWLIPYGRRCLRKRSLR